MRFPRLFGWSSLLFAGVALAVSALAQPPIADKEYKLINPPQRTETGKKIEVIEFFSYACPHCADFEPFLQDWLKRKPKDVEYRMVPMVFRENWKPLAKLFYTLEQMGLLERYHMRVFDAIHKQGQQLLTDQAVVDWAVKQGIDKAKFEQIYQSFGIDTKVPRVRRAVHAVAGGQRQVLDRPVHGDKSQRRAGHPALLRGGGRTGRQGARQAGGGRRHEEEELRRACEARAGACCACCCWAGPRSRRAPVLLSNRWAPPWICWKSSTTASSGNSPSPILRASRWSSSSITAAAGATSSSRI
jgi:thiol:disulfide interchange protein DsbA